MTARQEKYRKSTVSHHPEVPLSSKGDEYMFKDELANCQARTRSYSPVDYTSDNEFKPSEDERSSIDSYSLYDTNGSPDGNGDIDQHYRDYVDDIRHEKSIKNVMYSKNKRAPIYAAGNYDDSTFRTTNPQRNIPEYSTKKDIRATHELPNDLQSMIAEQKLQRLQELQRQRDYTEKYYSQKIRRLIDEQRFDNKPSNPVAGRQPPLYDARAFTTVPNYVGDRVTVPGFDNLRSCGTLTTVTHLDCGCIEQTTRPIFTTPNGRVQKRVCAQGQQVHMQMSMPSARLVVNNHSRLRSKSFAEPRSSPATAAAGAATAAAVASTGAQETVTKVSSPARKTSETSMAM